MKAKPSCWKLVMSLAPSLYFIPQHLPKSKSPDSLVPAPFLFTPSIVLFEYKLYMESVFVIILESLLGNGNRAITVRCPARTPIRGQYILGVYVSRHPGRNLWDKAHRTRARYTSR